MKKLFTIALFMSVALASTATQFTTRTFKLTDFTILDVSNVIKVVYTQGEPYSVKLTGQSDLINLVEVKAEGGKLSIKAKNSKKLRNVKKKDMPDGQHHFVLHLTAPCLENILLSGVCSFEAKRISPDYLFVRISGASKLNIDAVEVPSFHTEIDGASEVKVKDIACRELKVDIRGASKIYLNSIAATKCISFVNGASKLSFDKLTKNEEANFSFGGASKATINATTSGLLQVGLSGASNGELTYKGGRLRTACTGASKLNANVNCTAIQANCDGASKTNFSGTADKVEIDRSGVAVNIDTSRLNQF